MNEAQLQKIIELQKDFDSLNNQNLKKLEDKEYYNVELTSVEMKVSSKGNPYVQLNFYSDGYEPIVKRMMLSNPKTTSGLIYLAAKIGRSVFTLEDAVKFLNTQRFIFNVKIRNTDQNFYDVDLLGVKKYDNI